MSANWQGLFPLLTVRKLVREFSDHNALLLDSSSSAPSLNGSREFRFDTSWLKNEEFLPSVLGIWEEYVNSHDPIDIINIKLKRFRKYFKGWGSNIFGHNKKRKRELREELSAIDALEETNDLSPNLYIRKTDINHELFGIYAKEELLWFQRSHEKWLLEGDPNTSYFHRVANGRKSKNTMFSLKDNEVIIEGTKNLLQHATSYYKNLFGPAARNLIPFDPNIW
jgi:hypothetical protein